MTLLLTYLVSEEMESGLFGYVPKVTWGSGGPSLSKLNSELFQRINSLSEGKSNIFYHKVTFSKIFNKLIPQTYDLGRKIRQFPFINQGGSLDTAELFTC